MLDLNLGLQVLSLPLPFRPRLPFPFGVKLFQWEKSKIWPGAQGLPFRGLSGASAGLESGGNNTADSPNIWPKNQTLLRRSDRRDRQTSERTSAPTKVEEGTGNLYQAVHRLGECCREVEDEASNSRNKIHQTRKWPYRDSLYIEQARGSPLLTSRQLGGKARASRAPPLPKYPRPRFVNAARLSSFVFIVFVQVGIMPRRVAVGRVRPFIRQFIV